METVQPPAESAKAGFFSECNGVCDCAKTVALGLKNWMGNHKKIMGVVIAAIALQLFTGLPLMGAKMGLDYSLLGASYAFTAYAGYQSVKGIKALRDSRQGEAGGMKKCIKESVSNYKIVKYVLNPLVGTLRWIWGHTFGGTGTGNSAL